MTHSQFADIVGQFKSLILIAAGGQKVVYQIVHEKYGKCILKVANYNSPSSLERIHREVAILNEISSNYYPRQFEFHVVDDRRLYIVEEKVDGNPLSKVIDHFGSLEKATKIILHLVEGLKVIWGYNVIHRDLKPDNIIINKSGIPIIIDLGIARILNLQSITHSLAPIGPCTPAYASPEQLTNRKHEINHRTDQFSLGILFFQLLFEGRHPFSPEFVGRGESIVDNILSGRWDSESLINSYYDSAKPILSKMLAYHPHGRFRTPALLYEKLEHLC